MATIYQSGGSYLPNQNYDRTGATDKNGTYVTPITQAITIDQTGATLTLDPATHAGRVVMLDVASGVTVTLPAASGSGNLYRLVVATTVSSNSDTVKVANATDYMRGFALGATDTAGTAMAWATANTGTVATESDTIALNGTTKGGRVGDWIECLDIKKNVWAVKVFAVGSGTEASPFSAAVS